MHWLRRPKKLIRLHLRSDDRSVEGIFLGYEAGHYRLANARVLEQAGAEVQTIALDGEAWIPRDRVLYGQVIG